MNNKVQLVALYTHFRHEYARMARIPAQIAFPPLLTTLIYFLVFGAIIGKRLGNIDNVDYSTFITPGLVMLAVITNSYMNSSSSLFSARFQGSVEELIISPMSREIFLLGYVLGGVLRGVIVAIIVLAVATFFVDLNISNIIPIMAVVVLFASLFALAGFTNGMLVKTFDELSIVPTFILSPLIYLGGVFFSIDMLPPFWQKIAIFNPVYYMIDILRYIMIGYHTTNVTLSLICISSLTIGLLVLNIILLRRGIGMRN